MAKKADPMSEVDRVLAGYRKARAITADVMKTVSQETMDLQKKSEGKFFFSKGKLRLDFTQPDKTSLIYDGKTVWLETQLDEKTVQVTKIRRNELARSSSVVSALFENKNILRTFKLEKSSSTKGRRTYVFVPKKKKSDDEIQFLEVVLNKKELERIKYKDQIGNTVVFDFKNLTRGKVPATKFSYTPPKNAEVTEI